MYAAHLTWCRQRGLRPTTLTQRRRTLTRITRTVGPLHNATETAIRAWWDQLTIGADARITTLSHLRGYYHWATLEGLRADDPTVHLPVPRRRRRIPRPIPETDLAVALAAAPDRIRPWLLLAARAGLRACEIADLHAEHVRADLDPAVLVIADGKGGRQRVVPLHPSIPEALGGLPHAGYLFRRGDGQPGPVTANCVSHLTNRYLHSIGVTATLHQLRHRFGTRIYQLSLDLRLTQELLGHQTPVTTAGYAAWTPSRGAEVVGRLEDETRPREPV